MKGRVKYRTSTLANRGCPTHTKLVTTSKPCHVSLSQGDVVPTLEWSPQGSGCQGLVSRASLSSPKHYSC